MGTEKNNRSLYIADEDQPVWRHAEGRARGQGLSVSKLATHALSQLLQHDDNVITVPAGNRHWSPTTSFVGRWLSRTDHDDVHRDFANRSRNDPAYEMPDEGNGDTPQQWRVRIAETNRGRIAVYLHHWYFHVDAAGDPELHDFDSLAEARQKLGDDPRIPRDVWREVKYKLRAESTTWLDI